MITHKTWGRSTHYRNVLSGFKQEITDMLSLLDYKHESGDKIVFALDFSVLYRYLFPPIKAMESEEGECRFTATMEFIAAKFVIENLNHLSDYVAWWGTDTPVLLLNPHLEEASHFTSLATNDLREVECFIKKLIQGSGLQTFLDELETIHHVLKKRAEILDLDEKEMLRIGDDILTAQLPANLDKIFSALIPMTRGKAGDLLRCQSWPKEFGNNDTDHNKNTGHKKQDIEEHVNTCYQDIKKTRDEWTQQREDKAKKHEDNYDLNIFAWWDAQAYGELLRLNRKMAEKGKHIRLVFLTNSVAMCSKLRNDNARKIAYGEANNDNPPLVITLRGIAGLIASLKKDRDATKNRLNRLHEFYSEKDQTFNEDLKKIQEVIKSSHDVGVSSKNLMANIRVEAAIGAAFKEVVDIINQSIRNLPKQNDYGKASHSKGLEGLFRSISGYRAEATDVMLQVLQRIKMIASELSDESHVDQALLECTSFLHLQWVLSGINDTVEPSVRDDSYFFSPDHYRSTSVRKLIESIVDNWDNLDNLYSDVKELVANCKSPNVTTQLESRLVVLFLLLKAHRQEYKDYNERLEQLELNIRYYSCAYGSEPTLENEDLVYHLDFLKHIFWSRHGKLDAAIEGSEKNAKERAGRETNHLPRLWVQHGYLCYKKAQEKGVANRLQWLHQARDSFYKTIDIIGQEPLRFAKCHTIALGNLALCALDKEFKLGEISQEIGIVGAEDPARDFIRIMDIKVENYSNEAKKHNVPFRHIPFHDFVKACHFIGDWNRGIIKASPGIIIKVEKMIAKIKPHLNFLSFYSKENYRGVVRELDAILKKM